ncbi:hypothetical protein [Hymenobacter psoromatis]|uniref:hypothetical protein n=1 Tax=Hymenobacter psoromatis TaxID=1484116 RepID=UPI001CBC9231|nr:hypothetical protein [Hymenobacter psoromatis]
MSLTLPVLVRGINNLSDARYCAGMGAEGLIFTLDPTLPGAVDAATVRELAGWVAGVELIGEFGSLPAAEINRLVAECGLSRVLLRFTAQADGLARTPLLVPALIETPQFSTFDGAYRQQLTAGLGDALPAGFRLLTKVLKPDTDRTRQLMRTAAAATPLWLSGAFDPATLPALVAAVRPAGLILEGGNEIKPGLRDFTELEAVFEALEED